MHVQLLMPVSMVIFMTVQGPASDIAIQTNEILTLRRRINELYVKHTKQPMQTIGELR